MYFVSSKGKFEQYIEGVAHCTCVCSACVLLSGISLITHWRKFGNCLFCRIWMLLHAFYCVELSFLFLLIFVLPLFTQFGVLISRSSLVIVKIRWIEILTVLQVLTDTHNTLTHVICVFVCTHEHALLMRNSGFYCTCTHDTLTHVDMRDHVYTRAHTPFICAQFNFVYC